VEYNDCVIVVASEVCECSKHPERLANVNARLARLLRECSNQPNVNVNANFEASDEFVR